MVYVNVDRVLVLSVTFCCILSAKWFVRVYLFRAEQIEVVSAFAGTMESLMSYFQCIGICGVIQYCDFHLYSRYGLIRHHFC